MNDHDVRKFIALQGQNCSKKLSIGEADLRRLGAQLLLSEVLEYIIHGLGVTPLVNGQPITDPEGLRYSANNTPDQLHMLDGLSDVAYTMFWNAAIFGVRLEEAFELVCKNNLTKFVKLPKNPWSEGELPADKWHCGQEISWPSEVVKVEVVKVEDELYAVGKDARGKVRKPSSYQQVDLSGLLK